MTSEASSTPPVSTEVTVVTDGVPQVFTWEDEARITVRSLGAEVVIEANVAGLRTLAGHLLTLAKDGVPDGSHLHLEDSNGLAEGSVGLVLERSNEVD
ncbi:Imm32 family immunity protein [Streptomyces sp. NPDC004129]